MALSPFLRFYNPGFAGVWDNSGLLYLDHAATTPLRPEALSAIEPWQGQFFGNSSGSHAISRRAKNALEEAREQAAQVLGAEPNEIVFTGGGTEADNLALLGTALADRRPVITVATEHEAVLETARGLRALGCPLVIVDVDEQGIVNLDRLVDAVKQHPGAVVSVMTVNNETGVIQPIAEISAAIADSVGAFHTDAIQALSSQDLSTAGVDMLSLAAHKFGGPQGVGLLYVRDGIQLEPLVHGGGQEFGRRSGTHNIAGIVGMVAAMSAAVVDRLRFRADTEEARERFEAKLADRAVRTVDPALTTPQHSHLRFDQPNETLLINLDRLGLAASAGSACQSGAVEVSHVLAAMGMSDGARNSLRFSFGWTSLPEDGEAAAEIVLAALEEYR